MKYPVGIQTFSEIVAGDYLYLDKTDMVYEIVNLQSKYCFLSRPRRFGKSLLTSTLKSFFEGRKDLFRGLAIEKLEQEWEQYPVLHFDMSLCKHQEKEGLNRYLHEMLSNVERQFGIIGEAVDVNNRLTNLVVQVAKQTGKKVVILIDEYDSPLLDVMHEDEVLPQLRNVMRNFYSPLKALDPYLRFVFLTGITKFSQLSVFSELNNILNLSMEERYATICGITKDEILTQMTEGIDSMAQKFGISRSEMLNRLKARYDGYHFAWPSPDVFNPYCLLTAFHLQKLGPYWFDSGTPTFLIEMLRKYDVSPSELGNGVMMIRQDFDSPTERMVDVAPLLYQAGYYTVKGYDEDTDTYYLNIPNNEIRTGLMDCLLPNYVGHMPMGRGRVYIEMYRSLLRDDLDGALRTLQTFMPTIPYADNTQYEGHYQQLFYVIFSLFGYYVDVEVRTATGRVDMVMKMRGRLYLFELKLNQSAEAAMNQINLKDYPARFACENLPIIKVGINFSLAERNITDWCIVEAL